MQSVTPQTPRRPTAQAFPLVLLAMLALALGTLASCQSMNAKASSGKTRQSSRAASDCQSCYRLCDVGGKAQKNSAAAQKCKADCDEKCQ